MFVYTAQGEMMELTTSGTDGKRVQIGLLAVEIALRDLAIGSLPVKYAVNEACAV